MTDLYATLGVNKMASKDDIKSAYRKKAKEHHPDTGKKPDAAAFNDATKAYRLLTDESRRAKYDESGTIDDTALDDPVFNKAVGFLSLVFNHIMDRDDALSINVPRQLERDLRDLRDRISKNLEMGRAKLAKIEKMRKKLKRKKGRKGQDHLLRMMDQAIRDLHRPLEMAQVDLDAAKMALDMLDADGYDFEADLALPGQGPSLYDIINSMPPPKRGQRYEGF